MIIVHNYTQKDKRRDVFLMFPTAVFLFVLGIFAKLGYSEANYSTTYVATTMFICGLFCTVPFILRIKGLFVMPYWMAGLFVSIFYIHPISLYLGFYQYMEWWSPLSHTIGSIICTAIAFIVLILIQNYTRAVNLGVRPLYFMSFIIMMGLGTLWELLEVVIDLGSGVQYMSYSLYDNSEDIVFDAIGAVIALVCLSLMFRNKNMSEIIESFNIGHLMRKLGAKWDRHAGWDVETPENPKEFVDYKKWETTGIDNWFQKHD